MKQIPQYLIILSIFGFLLFGFLMTKSLVTLEVLEYSNLIGTLEYLFIILICIPFFFITTAYTKIKKDQNLKLKTYLNDLEEIVDNSALISKADSHGKITYVNEKFIQVSKYPFDEAIGQDHNFLNSGIHNREFWDDMYLQTTKYRKIWNAIVTNRDKNGDLYYVNTYIKATFHPLTDKLNGFISIRQDITETINSLEKLSKKEKEYSNILNAINSSTAVVEFCPNGNILSANKNFLNLMKCSFEDIKGKHHSIFIADKYAHSKEYGRFWNDIQNGKSKYGEYLRYDLENNPVWIQATYTPILDNQNKVYKIMKIMTDITDAVVQREELNKKNVYLEHAAKILRHDMHSGINTYIPKGISSLERRLNPEIIKELKLEVPLKLIKEGLLHSQKVYSGVKEFTNLVKKDAVLNKSKINIKSALEDYLARTSYRKQVIIEELIDLEINESLFCTAVDNLIRNGLKYNDSASKFVKISMDKSNSIISVQDNGRGMSQRDFEYLSQPYTRRNGQAEQGSGLGLNICVAILTEHGFKIRCEKNKVGTNLKIYIN